MIVKLLQNAADALFRGARHSRLLGAIAAKEEKPPSLKRSGRLFRWRQRLLRWQEESLLRTMLLQSVQRCGAVRTHDLGLLMATSTISAVIVRLMKGERGDLLLPMALLAGALPLLLSAEALQTEARKSLFLRRFFAEAEPAPSATRGASMRGLLFGAGLVLGGLSAWIPLSWITLLCLLPLGLRLQALAPDAMQALTAFALPFLHLAEHPTALLVAVLLLQMPSLLWKSAVGRRQLRFCSCDLLAVGLSLLWLMGGTEGMVKSFLLISAWFSVRLLFGERHRRRRFFGALGMGGAAASMVGILQYLLGKAPVGWVDMERFGDLGGRACGFFDNPNVFAVFLLLSLPMLLPSALSGRTTLERMGGRGLLAVGSLCVLLTWSRGAWLGWMLAAVTALLCYSRAGAAVLFGALLPAGALLARAPEAIRSRLFSIVQLGESSIRYRLQTWHGVARMLAEQPFGIGCGDGVFHREYPKYAVSGTETVMHAHSLWLQLGVEIGITGVLLFAALIVCLLRRAVRALQDCGVGEARGEVVALLAASVGLLTMGLFDSLWYQTSLFWGLWAVPALLCNATEEEALHENEKKNERFGLDDPFGVAFDTADGGVDAFPLERSEGGHRDVG